MCGCELTMTSVWEGCCQRGNAEMEKGEKEDKKVKERLRQPGKRRKQKEKPVLVSSRQCVCQRCIGMGD